MIQIRIGSVFASAPGSSPGGSNPEERGRLTALRPLDRHVASLLAMTLAVQAARDTLSMLRLGGTRLVIASEAKQSRERRGLTFLWIASSLALLAMTIPSPSNFLSLTSHGITKTSPGAGHH